MGPWRVQLTVAPPLLLLRALILWGCGPLLPRVESFAARHVAPNRGAASVYVNLPFCRRRCFYCDFPIKVRFVCPYNVVYAMVCVCAPVSSFMDAWVLRGPWYRVFEGAEQCVAHVKVQIGLVIVEPPNLRLSTPSFR